MPVTMRISGIIETGNSNAGAMLEASPGVVARRWRSPDMSTISPSLKTCTRCDAAKPLTDFYTQPNGKPRSQCKRCISDHRNAYNKRLREEQPDVIRQWDRNHYERHRERRIAESKEYHRNHPWQDRYKWRRRRAERLGVAVVDLTPQQWRDCVDYFNNRCAYCHDPLTQDGQDHILPVSKGGNHTLSNVVPVCRSCNTAKLNLSLIECLIKERI